GGSWPRRLRQYHRMEAWAAAARLGQWATRDAGGDHPRRAGVLVEGPPGQASPIPDCASESCRRCAGAHPVNWHNAAALAPDVCQGARGACLAAPYPDVRHLTVSTSTRRRRLLPCSSLPPRVDGPLRTEG